MHASKPIAFCVLFCLCSVIHTKAQDTLYFDKTYEAVPTPASAYYMEIRDYDAADSNRCAIRTFLADSSRLVSVRKYSDYKHLIFHGKCLEWHRNGTLYQEIRYDNGKLQGTQKVFYPNGQLSKKIEWDHDTIVSGAFLNEDGSPKTQVYREDLAVENFQWQRPPSFPGGADALFDFLARTIQYPAAAKEDFIQGIVLLSFIVEKNGQLGEIKVISKPQKVLDDEALRVLRKMPRWNPGAVDGVPVRVRYTMPCRFKLE